MPHYQAEKWALDDVAYHTEVTAYERVEQVRREKGELLIGKRGMRTKMKSRYTEQGRKKRGEGGKEPISSPVSHA
jgi:hypothetical protein